MSFIFFVLFTIFRIFGDKIKSIKLIYFMSSCETLEKNGNQSSKLVKLETMTIECLEWMNCHITNKFA